MTITTLETKPSSNDSNGKITLCHTGNVLPYVTWAEDGDRNRSWGHYFKTLEAALADFKERA